MRDLCKPFSHSVSTQPAQAGSESARPTSRVSGGGVKKQGAGRGRRRMEARVQPIDVRGMKPHVKPGYQRLEVEVTPSHSVDGLRVGPARYRQKNGCSEIRRKILDYGRIFAGHWKSLRSLLDLFVPSQFFVSNLYSRTTT
jgi:hypothetical protein